MIAKALNAGYPFSATAARVMVAGALELSRSQGVIETLFGEIDGLDTHSNEQSTCQNGNAFKANQLLLTRVFFSTSLHSVGLVIGRKRGSF